MERLNLEGITAVTYSNLKYKEAVSFLFPLKHPQIPPFLLASPLREMEDGIITL